MPQLIQQIAGLIIFMLLSVFVVFRLLNIGLDAMGLGPKRPVDDRLGGHGEPRWYRKGEEVPRHSEPLPVGKAYGDKEQGQGLSKRASLSLIILVALVGLAVVYFMPDMPMGVSYLDPPRRGGEWEAEGKVAHAVVISLAAVAATVYVVSSGTERRKGRTRTKSPRNQEESELQFVQDDWEELTHRRRQARRKRKRSQ